MSDLRDIEEGPEEETVESLMDIVGPRQNRRSKTKDNGICNNSFKNHKSFMATKSRTTKLGSCVFTVDPSILELAKVTMDTEHFDVDSVHEQHGATRFCGSFCDLVRTCLIVNCFYIFKNVQVIITIILGLSYARPLSTTDDDSQLYYDDDYYYHSKGDDDQETGSMMFLILITKNVVGVLFATIGIVGTQSFQKWLVLSTTIWCGIDAVVSVLTERWLAAVLAGFFVYPELALFLALHRNKITSENYNEIKYCCCTWCSKTPKEEVDDEIEEDDNVDINLDDDDDYE